MNLYVGSGDVKALLMGKKTKGHGDLFRKFVSDTRPNYNALASPLDAARTGAILEEVYITTLGADYYAQVVVTSTEMDVFKSSLDFAKMENDEVVDFDELKTIWFTEFVETIQPLLEIGEEKAIEYIKNKFKAHYHQIQQQLYTTRLDEANLVFLSVVSYDDEDNYTRKIEPNEIIKFRIKRDESVIDTIKQRGVVFQQIKDSFNE